MPDPNPDDANDITDGSVKTVVDDDTTDDTDTTTDQIDDAPPSIDEGDPKTTDDGSGTSETD